MRIIPNLSRACRNAGNVLLMVVVVSGLLGLAVVAYLRLITSQNSFTTRSQVWNNCLPVVEAGIEEALAQLNKNSNGTLAANGWTGTPQNFTKMRAMGDGYYSVTIWCTNLLSPTITSIGYLPAPVTIGSGVPDVMVAAAFTPDLTKKYISRTVRVTARRDPAFPKAMVAKSKIDFKGNNVRVDSYKSSVGLYSAATCGDKGDVTMNGDLANTGNGDIWGHLIVGPKTTLKNNPNGTVGSLAWHNAGKKGIEPGWLRSDANIAFPDVMEPWPYGTAQSITAGGGAMKYVFEGGNYDLPNLIVSSTEKINVQTNTTIYVKGNVSIAGDIKIAPGAKLRIYIAGANATFSGTYDRQDPKPGEFLIYGLPNLKTIDINEAAAAIYAPNAAMNMNGNAQFYGSSLTDSVFMNGNTGFHYDEDLANLSGMGYTITSWNEI